MVKLPTSTVRQYSYRLDEKPMDMGSGGNSLNWDTYLNDKEIVKIKILDNNTIEFHWLGFYNAKTRKREFLQNDITEEAGKNPLILHRCED